MIKRLIVTICLLLKENPVLPLSFNFGGECLLQRLKREREELKQVQNERKLLYNSELAKRRQMEMNPVPSE